MKRFMISTALVALTITPAMAQTTTGTTTTDMTVTGASGVSGPTFYQRMEAEDILASDFMGKSVYVSEGPVEGRRFGRSYMGTGTVAGTPGTAGDNAIVVEGDVAVGEDTVVVTDADTRPAGTTGAATTGTTGVGAGTVGTGTVGTGTGTTGTVGTGLTGTAGTGTATTGVAPGSTTLPADPAARPGVAGMQAGWEDVGSINDIVMSRDGEVQAVLVDVGGFLGIGARTVAVDIDALTIVDDQNMNDFYVVFTSSRADLENAPEYQLDAVNTQNTLGTTGTATTGTATTGTTAPVGTAAPGAMTGMGTGTTVAQEPVVGQPRVTPAEGYVVTEAAAISVDELGNANLYDPTNENVGSVNDVLVGTDGEIQGVTVDIGGFLGLGSRTVALDFEQLEFHRAQGAAGADLRVYVPMTREELEALPEYE